MRLWGRSGPLEFGHADRGPRDPMPKLPVMSGPELLRKLRRIGFAVDHTTGSHVILWNSVTRRRAVVPTHRRDLPRGTIASIVREAGVDWRELL